MLQLQLTKHLPRYAATDGVLIYVSVAADDVPRGEGNSKHFQPNSAKQLQYMNAVT